MVTFFNVLKGNPVKFWNCPATVIAAERDPLNLMFGKDSSKVKQKSGDLLCAIHMNEKF